jgi:hypothetical protein
MRTETAVRRGCWHAVEPSFARAELADRVSVIAIVSAAFGPETTLPRVGVRDGGVHG